MHSKLDPVLLLPLALAACHSDSDSGPEPASEPLVINHGLATQLLVGSGELRLAAVAEADQGLDLVGDGDLEDVVLHLLDLGTGALTNTGLALTFTHGFGDQVPPNLPSCNDALAVFQVSEEATGQDLDGDGMTDEVATWTFNRRTGQLLGLPLGPSSALLGGDLAVFQTGSGLLVFDARDGGLTTIPVRPSGVYAVSDGLVAFTREEEGAFDLNADGDTGDSSVVHLFDSATGRVANTSFDAFGPFGMRLRAEYVGFSVLEGLHGMLDLNGDGDAEDLVFVGVNGKNGLVRIPGLVQTAPADFRSPAGAGFLLEVGEGDFDRNGDGDQDDRIAVVYDPVTDTVQDTGLALAIGSIFPLGRWVGVPVSEQGQGGTDLDGDGAVASIVPHVFDTQSGVPINLGFQGVFIAALDQQLLGARITDVEGSSPQLDLFAWDARTRSTRFPGVDLADVRGTAGDEALLFVPEREGDLNGDGDQADLVLAVLDGATLSVRNLGLAVAGDSSLAPNGRAAVLVSEAAQGGTDLNGDGDASDLVLHEIVLDPPGP